MNSVSCFPESQDRKLRALALQHTCKPDGPKGSPVCVQEEAHVRATPSKMPPMHRKSATTVSGHTLIGPEAASDRNNEGAASKSLCAWATCEHRNTKTHLRSEKGKMERRRDL